MYSGVVVEIGSKKLTGDVGYLDLNRRDKIEMLLEERGGE